ncbi:MAG: ExeM/NucH family extracellular endonuclease, partial [Chloroflexi bacterium]|nr:ExeM/NucH family extracellular endonuclease [Chloroflexota bacterium]
MHIHTRRFATRFTGLFACLLVIGLLPWSWSGNWSTSGAAPAYREGGCGDPATPIHAIQGTDLRSPQVGQRLTIEGVVTADFQETLTGLGGFFLQEEDDQTDGDPRTSEGIFVNDGNNINSIDVNVGDVVRVEGSVNEIDTSFVVMTQFRNVRSMTLCGTGASVAAIEMTLPVSSLDEWEAVEGMLVTLPQTLTVAEGYNLGRYGQMLLNTGDRLSIPTEVVPPGDPARALAEENLLRTIMIDDGSNEQNPDPVPYPPEGLTAENTLRAGDQISSITGVVEHSFGVYRIHTTQPVTVEYAALRPTDPPDVGGRLTVAAFNVLNYFNGDGQGGGYPTPRGARDPEEFTRQRDKIITAILALDADVIGLMEIENDGYGPESAVADLVDGLNAVAGEGTYAYIIDPEGFELPIENSREGGDEIKVALIYRPASVTPVGPPMTTVDPPFDRRRPSLTQTFDEVATGERFTVVVNHFKSKGCSGAGGLNRDQDDGQSCFNQERVEAAQTLSTWLATDPTNSGDPDFLIIGDLNAYAMEDPLMVFQDAGYVNLLLEFPGTADYSYVYFGEAGTLDHALGTASILPQVTGAAAWHINADEPRILDYVMQYKSE